MQFTAEQFRAKSAFKLQLSKLLDGVDKKKLEQPDKSARQLLCRRGSTDRSVGEFQFLDRSL